MTLGLKGIVVADARDSQCALCSLVTVYQNGSIDTSFDPPLFSLDSTIKQLANLFGSLFSFRPYYEKKSVDQKVQKHFSCIQRNL
jgi:hypothetical protein